MKFTNDIRVLRTLLKKNVPEEDNGNHNKVMMYVQDITASIDYYIISWSPKSNDFLALTDPLRTDNVLDIEHAPLSFLDDNRLYYTVLGKTRQVTWMKKYNELLPLKHGIPSEYSS